MRNGRIKLEYWLLAAILAFVINPIAGWVMIGLWVFGELSMWIMVLYDRLTSRSEDP